MDILWLSRKGYRPRVPQGIALNEWKVNNSPCDVRHAKFCSSLRVVPSVKDERPEGQLNLVMIHCTFFHYH